MLDRRSLLAGSSALLVGGGALGLNAKALAQTASDPSGASAQLAKVFEDQFQAMLAASPQACSRLGLDKGPLASQKSKLDGVSPQDRQNRLERTKALITALKGVDRTKLTGMDAINYDIVLTENEKRLKAAARFDFGSRGTQPYVLSQLTGSYQSTPDFLDNQHTITTIDDAEAYLSRLNAFAGVLTQEVENLKSDVAKGVVPPDFILQKTLTQLTTLRNTPAVDTTLVKSLVRRTAEKALSGEWGTRAQALVEGPIHQALDLQIKALQALLPQASHDAGMWRLKDGEAYYAYCASEGTTTDMMPEDIHKLGLEKVKEITAQIDGLFKSQGKTQGTVGERLQALAKDPKFLYDNTDEAKEKLLLDLNGYIEAMSKRLPDYFGTLPKSKVVVRRVPKAIEVGAPGGYYQSPSLDGSRPGAYYINLRDTAETPRWELPTLSYHEAIPGHHLQRSIQTEAKALPMLRRIAGFTAYTEGWALYAEQLADEMGVYETDPFGKIGYLKAALFRSVRLVVDTGMHAKHWSREQAIRYMVEVGGDAESSATTEIERYCVWPGQALAYMTGKIQWLKLRAASQKKLGAKFDIKAFHDLGLTSGPMPLGMLEHLYSQSGQI